MEHEVDYDIQRTSFLATQQKLSACRFLSPALTLKLGVLDTQSVYSKSNDNTASSSLINRIYFERYILLHELFEFSLLSILRRHDMQNAKGPYNNKCQIVIFGAGIDISYENHLIAMHNRFPDLNKLHFNIYVLDSESVLRKRERLPTFPNQSIFHVPVDLRHWSTVYEQLSANGFVFKGTADSDVYTIAIEECVFCYIDEKFVHTIIQEMVRTFHEDTLFLGYMPLLSPRTGELESGCKSLSVAIRNGFASRGAPILSGEDNVEMVEERFHRSGWTRTLCMDVQTALKAVMTPEEVIIPAALDPFDEFASLATINRYYAVIVSALNADLFQSTVRQFHLYNNNNCTSSVDSSHLLARIRSAENPSSHLSLESFDKSKYEVRQCSTEDIASIKRIYTESFTDLSEKYVAVRKFISSSANKLKKIENIYLKNLSMGSNFFVALYGSTVIGSVGVKVSVNSQSECNAEVSHMCVVSNHRRRGVGRMLIEKLLSHCREWSVKTVHLSVLQEMLRARSLYEAAGFEPANTVNLEGECKLDYMKLILHY